MPSRLRESVLAARQQLIEGKAKIRELHDRGGEGVQVCAKLTSLVDAVLGALFEGTLANVTSDEADQLRERISLVAHGGYGRRHMAPHSDIDLMFLIDGKPDALVKNFTQQLMHDIFDAGEQLGHSVRSISEATQMARQDAQICTSLLESRCVVGSVQLYESFADEFSKMVQRRGWPQCRLFIEARREERQKYGESVYLLEPNIKRSRGGLRDMHLLRWLWFVKSGVAEPDRLHSIGVISKFDYRRLVSARNLLLRVRNDMHFEAGMANDVVSRGEQMRLADKLGFRGKPGLHPAEQFMRDYFQATAHVWRLSHRLSELVAEPSTVSRVLETVLERSVEKDYRLGIREISATSIGRDKLKKHIGEALRLVHLARLHDKWISQDTYYSVYRAAPKFPKQLEPEIYSQFLELLDTPKELSELLRRLRGMGVLERILPEFSHARYLLQINQYHKYTVDEHCILAVEEATRLAEHDDRVGEVYKQIEKKRLLHLALLIHDLGKGYEEDHSEVGRRIAVATAERFNLTDSDAETLEFLVHKHLAMAHLALRRDTNQVELVREFSDVVKTPERLQLLYLLSCADLAAVGPGVLNSWKLGMLTNLYERTLAMLSPKKTATTTQRRQDIRQHVWQELTPEEASDAWFKRQFECLPEGFIAERPVGEIVETLRRFHDLKDQSGTAWGKYIPSHETIEFIAGVDRGSGRGVFSSLAGVLTSRGMEILTAETATLSDGLILQVYNVADKDFPGQPTTDRLNQISNAMVAAIDSDKVPTFRSTWESVQLESHAALSNLPQEVRLFSELSAEWMVFEIVTWDRPGILYHLARAFHDLKLIIKFAKIGTYVDQVIDVFYVTERDGSKPTEEHRLKEIRTRLEEVIHAGS